MNKKYICPICGYDGLDMDPLSDEICSCCGYHFGTGAYYDNSNYPVDVGVKFNYEENENFYNYVRELWIKRNCKWSECDQKPQDWNPLKQLQNLNLSQEQIESFFSEKRKNDDLPTFENKVIKFFTDKIPEIEDFVSLTTLTLSYFDEAGMYTIIADINGYFENCIKNGRFDKAETFLKIYWDFYKEFEEEYHKLKRSDTMKNLTRVELFETIDAFDEKVKEKVIKLLPEELKKDYLSIS